MRTGDSHESKLDAGSACAPRDHYGVTPLFLAASCGNVDTVRQILRAGSRADLTDDLGYTAVHRSASNRDAGITGPLPQGRHWCRELLSQAEEQSKQADDESDFSTYVWRPHGLPFSMRSAEASCFHLDELFSQVD
ncbi:MAG TPA: ankyrin repeat domain-containing protein [Noviherbaspirillum sp.]|nr:ankyrin repeat domain-containing protein [Noviherbaspirillum sp.]